MHEASLTAFLVGNNAAEVVEVLDNIRFGFDRIKLWTLGWPCATGKELEESLHGDFHLLQFHKLLRYIIPVVSTDNCSRFNRSRLSLLGILSGWCQCVCHGCEQGYATPGEKPGRKRGAIDRKVI